MESASIDPQPADGGTLYPKPEGWDWMTDDERYEALKQEPKPDHAAAKNALLQARRSVLHDIYSERKAIEEARQALIWFGSPAHLITPLATKSS